MKTNEDNLRGFTLIELMFVVAVIGILAGIAIPNFLEAQTRSKIARVKSDLALSQNALESYYLDHNVYPDYNEKEPEVDYDRRYGYGYYGRYPEKEAADDHDYHYLPRRLTTPTSYLHWVFH